MARIKKNEDAMKASFVQTLRVDMQKLKQPTKKWSVILLRGLNQYHLADRNEEYDRAEHQVADGRTIKEKHRYAFQWNKWKRAVVA